MKKKYLNLLTISCGILLMSAPAGYAAGGSGGSGGSGGNEIGFDNSSCPSGHYYQANSCHLSGSGYTPAAEGAAGITCHCLIENGEWGHWYCCSPNSAGHGGGSINGGNVNWHIIPSGNNNGSGCNNLSGSAKQCCEAGFMQHGTPLNECPSTNPVFMRECPYDSSYWSCLDYATACEVLGYSTGIDDCEEGMQKTGCPYNAHLDANNRYYQCRDIPCYGKVKCMPINGKNIIGCKNGESSCFKDGDIYCSANSCEYDNSENNGGMCRQSTPSNDVGSISDNGDGESISCSTEEMRNCDALGYLQNANDCPNGDRLTCPFDDNRFYCGGKIVNNVSNGVKNCYSAVIENMTGLVTNTSLSSEDCNRFYNSIPIYNACIRQTCAKECYLDKTSDYCVSEYSTAVYRLRCDDSRECQDDIESDSDDDTSL